jgi:hypothetical protein
MPVFKNYFNQRPTNAEVAVWQFEAYSPGIGLLVGVFSPFVPAHGCALK